MIHDALPDDQSVAKFIERLSDGEKVKGWDLKDRLLYYHEHIYVPNEPEIRKAVLESHHDNPVAGHLGQF